MKSILKKFIIIIVITAILMNFSLFQNVSFAGTFEDTMKGLLGSFVGLITWFIRLPAVGVAFVMNMLTADIAYLDKATAGNVVKQTITPYDIFFNKVQLFDINFFDFSISQDLAVYTIRTSVAGWFTIMRLVAVSILLVILIYVGIRMALTTIAEDKARYKQMLVDWIVSLLLVFVLHFIVIFAVNVNNALVNAIGKAGGGNDALGEKIKEIGLKGLGISTTALGATVVYCMIVWQTFSFVLTYITRTIKLAFLIIISPLITITYAIDKMGDGKSQALNAWLKEFLYTILMQPFHCIIYMTMVDLAFNLLIDPKTSDGLAECVLAILCIKFVKTAENIVKEIFNIKPSEKSGTLDAGAVAAGAALSKAKDIGKTARKTVNFAKEAKIGEKIKKTADKTRTTARAIAIGRQQKANGEEKTSFASRKMQAESQIAKEREDKKNSEAWKMYKKHEKSYTTDDKRRILQEAKQIQKENPNMKHSDALKQAATKVSREKIASGAYKNKTIRKVRGFAKKVSSSETYKHLKQTAKTVIPAGIGLAAGSMSFADNNIVEASMTGAAVGKSMQYFMASSTNTFSNNIAEQLKNKGIYSPEEGKEEVLDIKQKGDSGQLDGIGTAISKELERVLGRSNATSLMELMSKHVRAGNGNFDVEGMMKNMMPAENISEDKVALATQFKGHLHDQLIYANLESAAGVGVSAETLANKASTDLDTELTDETFVEGAKDTIMSEASIKAVMDRKPREKEKGTKYQDDHDLFTIESKLDKEISKVDAQLTELQNMVSGLTGDERRKVETNISNLQKSKEMLSKNKTNVRRYKDSIMGGENS